jgi:phosphoribosylamine--glycine ligase
MRVLIIGGGGREHALAWRLRRERPDLELLAAPGNPGIAELAECVPIGATDLPALQRLAADRRADLTVVGPEAPLAAGIVDCFRAAGLAIFGPTKSAAEIETSKAFAKRLMLEEGIPTARAEAHTRSADAKRCAARFGAPVVIKASGLAAGKGVLVCAKLSEANAAIEDMLEANRFGDAGAEVLVEEFMHGEEVSVFALTDGRAFVPLPPLQDHKRLRDGDQGPNTGGMGAYLPVSLASRLGDRVASTMEATADLIATTSRTVIAPTLQAMVARGRPFTGLLYAGLMITRDGPKVVEFNCRFGDPETQALMPMLGDFSLLDAMMAIAAGDLPSSAPASFASGACVTTVLAAANYPETPRTGDVITMPGAEDGVIVFHAGTARNGAGRLVTAGGRVLAVSAVAPTVADAHRRSLDFADRVDFDGKQLRTDIGWREIARRVER